MIIDSDRTVVLETVSKEMIDWLEENYSRGGDFCISDHLIRYRYAGPNVPLSEQCRPEGYEIHFSTPEIAMAFKLRWI